MPSGRGSPPISTPGCGSARSADARSLFARFSLAPRGAVPQGGAAVHDAPCPRRRRRWRPTAATRPGSAARARSGRMDHAGFQDWLNRYIDAWRSGDPAAIGDLFSENAQYFYGPYRDPVSGRAAIVRDWTAEPDAPGSWEAE